MRIKSPLSSVYRLVGVSLLAVALIMGPATTALGDHHLECVRDCNDAHRHAIAAADSALALANTACHNTYLAGRTACTTGYNVAINACANGAIDCEVGYGVVYAGALAVCVFTGPFALGCVVAATLGLDAGLAHCIIRLKGCQNDALVTRDGCIDTTTANLNACYATADAVRSAAEDAADLAYDVCLRACDKEQ